MKIEIDKSFIKSLNKLNLPDIKPKIETILKEIEKAQSLSEIKQIKKLKGYKNYYRIKSGDYRIGIESIDSETILLILISHLKDIYKRFP